MGLERVVLNAIKSADTEIAENASFFNGTLLLEDAAKVPGLRLWRVINAIKSVVTCSIQLTETDNDVYVDFI
jgi:hypothetical protein